MKTLLDLPAELRLNICEPVVSEINPICINKGWHETGLAGLMSTLGTNIDLLHAYYKCNAFVYDLWGSHRDELDYETLARFGLRGRALSKLRPGLLRC